MQSFYGRALGVYYCHRQFLLHLRTKHMLPMKVHPFLTTRLGSLNLPTFTFVSTAGSSFQSGIFEWAWPQRMLPGCHGCRMSSCSRTEHHADNTGRESSSGDEERGNNRRRNRNETPLSSLVKDEAVDFDKLTADERHIYRLHKEACQTGKNSYIDPSTGYIVLTQLEHINRGKCCGSCCRHCPYGHVNVLEKYRTKKFNTAFFV